MFLSKGVVIITVVIIWIFNRIYLAIIIYLLLLFGILTFKPQFILFFLFFISILFLLIFFLFLFFKIYFWLCYLSFCLNKSKGLYWDSQLLNNSNKIWTNLIYIGNSINDKCIIFYYYLLTMYFGPPISNLNNRYELKCFNV